MIRSVFLALTAALILVALLAWKSILSVGFDQVMMGWTQLSSYWKHETITLPGVITNEDQISPLIPKMAESGVSLVNAPFPQTQTAQSQLMFNNGECESTKPNLDKTSIFLRTNLFEPLAPITATYDRSATLSPELEQFLKDYGYGRHTITTNNLGERSTFPLVKQPRKVIIAGGPVAFGVAIDDANSLASKLQATDGARQYLTLAIPEGSAEQIICNLANALPRYHGEVDQLVYFYAESDLDPERKFGTPEEVMTWLKDLVQNEAVPQVTVVYSPSIYSLVPQFTRHKGNGSEWIANPRETKRRLREMVASANFQWLDIGEIAMTAAQGTEFSALSNFADDENLSLQGISNLAEKLRPPVEPIVQTQDDKTATANTPARTELERRAQQQSEALDDIRAAAARAAPGNRLKREIGGILKKLKDELDSDATTTP